MSLQYITDDEGQTTGVFIPIREWNELTSRYKGIEQDVYEVPEWQKEIIRERIKKSKKNPERLLDWEQVKNDFKFD